MVIFILPFCILPFYIWKIVEVLGQIVRYYSFSEGRSEMDQTFSFSGIQLKNKNVSKSSSLISAYICITDVGFVVDASCLE